MVQLWDIAPSPRQAHGRAYLYLFFRHLIAKKFFLMLMHTDDCNFTNSTIFAPPKNYSASCLGCSKTSIWSIKKENKKEKNSHTFASVAFFMNAPIAPIAYGELQLISLCVYWKIGFNWCNCASLSLLLSLTNTLSHFPAGSLLWGQQLSITRSELSSDLRLAAAIICMMRVVWAHVSNVMWTSVFSNPMQKFSRP